MRTSDNQKRYWNICVDCTAVAAAAVCSTAGYDDDDDREIDVLQIPCAVMFSFAINVITLLSFSHTICIDMKLRPWTWMANVDALILCVWKGGWGTGDGWHCLYCIMSVQNSSLFCSKQKHHFRHFMTWFGKLD